MASNKSWRGGGGGVDGARRATSLRSNNGESDDGGSGKVEKELELTMGEKRGAAAAGLTSEWLCDEAICCVELLGTRSFSSTESEEDVGEKGGVGGTSNGGGASGIAVRKLPLIVA